MTSVTNIFNKLESSVTQYLVSRGVNAPIVKIERPIDFQYGDLSITAPLKYAKSLGLPPHLLAQELSNHIASQQLRDVLFVKSVLPGYVNIFLKREFFADLVTEILMSPDSFGANDSMKGQKWVVEHTSPNPNKAMHLGHLRNNLIGMGIIRALLWSGASVISDAVDNNRGIAIAKLMWGFLACMRKEEDLPIDVDYWVNHQDQWFTPDDLKMLPDAFVTRSYLRGESDFRNNPVAAREIRNCVLRWESGDEDVRSLWSHVLKYSYRGIQRTLRRIGNHWDVVWHENEHYKDGKRFVSLGLEKGLFRKLTNGLVVTNLAKYNIPDTVVLRSDGTSLYITQDIALTALKKRTYNADRLVWVVGPEQSLAMRQLFAICDQLGIGRLEEFTHVSYGYVGIRDIDGTVKKMSSRNGTVVLIDDIIDTARERIYRTFLSQGRMEGHDLLAVSEQMALAAIKFGLLKSERRHNINFDVNQSVGTKGDSGVYVLYTYARMQSVIDKSQNQVATKSGTDLPAGPTEEADLVKLLMFFPDLVKMSVEDLSVHHIAQYLLEVCATFNTWYGKERILDGSQRASHKIRVVKATSATVRNGLSILGVNVVERI